MNVRHASSEMFLLPNSPDIESHFAFMLVEPDARQTCPRRLASKVTSKQDRRSKERYEEVGTTGRAREMG